MHYFKILFLFLFISASIFASDFIDVIHLKNGDIAEGTIIENVPNEYVKLEITSNTVLTFKYSEIEKFTRRRTKIIKDINMDTDLKTPDRKWEFSICAGPSYQNSNHTLKYTNSFQNFYLLDYLYENGELIVKKTPDLNVSFRLSYNLFDNLWIGTQFTSVRNDKAHESSYNIEWKWILNSDTYSRNRNAAGIGKIYQNIFDLMLLYQFNTGTIFTPKFRFGLSHNRGSLNFYDTIYIANAIGNSSFTLIDYFEIDANIKDNFATFGINIGADIDISIWDSVKLRIGSTYYYLGAEEFKWQFVGGPYSGKLGNIDIDIDDPDALSTSWEEDYGRSKIDFSHISFNIGLIYSFSLSDFVVH